MKCPECGGENWTWHPMRIMGCNVCGFEIQVTITARATDGDWASEGYSAGDPSPRQHTGKRGRRLHPGANTTRRG